MYNQAYQGIHWYLNRAVDDLENKGIDATSLGDDEWSQRVRAAQENKRFGKMDNDFNWVSGMSLIRTVWVQPSWNSLDLMH